MTQQVSCKSSPILLYSFAYLRFVHSDIMRCYNGPCLSLVAWSVYTTNCISFFVFFEAESNWISLRTSCLLKRHSAKHCRDLTYDCLLKNCRFKEFCTHQMYFGYRNQIKWTCWHFSEILWFFSSKGSYVDIQLVVGTTLKQACIATNWCQVTVTSFSLQACMNVSLD